MVRLRCTDDAVIQVERANAEHSNLIKQLLDDYCDDNDSPDTPIPIPEVSASVMVKCMVFVAYMRSTQTVPEIVKPLPSSNLAKHINDVWYAEYITEDVDKDLLFKIVSAAEYLDI